MSFTPKMLAGVAYAGCALFCGQTNAQPLAQALSSGIQSRTPSSGQGTDGTPLYNTPESTAEGVLKEMASRAAVIFTGTVTIVKKGSDEDIQSNAAARIVEVDFTIDHAVKGVTAGSVYVMREWAGLWRDSPRFTVGQRVLMLLHAAGASGLSSPVDGLDGAIPIKPIASAAPLAALTSGTTGDGAQEDAVDMRWLQAKTLRVSAIADAPVASPGESFIDKLAATQTFGASAASAQTTPAVPSKTAGLGHILDLLISWQEPARASH